MEPVIEKWLLQGYQESVQEIDETDPELYSDIIDILLRKNEIAFLNSFLYDYTPKLKNIQLSDLADIFITDKTRILYDQDVKERVTVDDLEFYMVLYPGIRSFFWVAKLIPLQLSVTDMQKIVTGMQIHTRVIEEIIKYRTYDYLSIPEIHASAEKLWIKLTERFEDTISHLYYFTDPRTKKRNFVNFIFDSDGEFQSNEKLLSFVPSENCHLRVKDIYHKIVDEYIRSSDFINFSLRKKKVSALAGYKIHNLTDLIRSRGKVYQQCTLFRGVKPYKSFDVGDIVDDLGFMSKTSNIVSALVFSGRTCCIFILYYPTQNIQLDVCFKDNVNNLQYEKMTFPGERFRIVDKGEMIWKTRILTAYYAEYIGNLYTRPISIDRTIDSRYYTVIKPILQRGGVVMFILDSTAPRTYFGEDLTMVLHYDDLYYTNDNFLIKTIKNSKDKALNVIKYKDDREIFQTYVIHTKTCYHLPLLSMNIRSEDKIEYEGEQGLKIVTNEEELLLFIGEYIELAVKWATVNGKVIELPRELSM